jgi:hypothetical protein
MERWEGVVDATACTVSELRELLALAERQAWQPISGARRDRSMVLVHGDDPAADDINISRDMYIARFGEGAWYCARTGHVLSPQPTYYLPGVPDPPKGESR